MEAGFWGEALVPWPPGVVARMDVSHEDRAYLTGIGLPTGVDWNLSIDPPADEGALQFCEGLPVLAFDGPVPLCFDKATGSVVAVEAVAVEAAGWRTVNSSISRFGFFLMLYQDYRLRVRDLEDAEACRVIDAMERAMRSRDPPAMSDPEGYWPIALEQMRDGGL